MELFFLVCGIERCVSCDVMDDVRMCRECVREYEVFREQRTEGDNTVLHTECVTEEEHERLEEEHERLEEAMELGKHGGS